MKKILICMILTLLFVGVISAQTKSVTGTIVDHWVNNKGTSESITIKVGNKEYIVSLTRPDLRQPSTTGNVTEVGRFVRVYYTKLVSNNELRATRVVEIKKPRS